MPDSSPCWANYGWAQYQFGHIPESIDSSRRAIALDPNAVTARYNLALCYAVTDRWSLAEPIYRKGIELDDAQESQGALSDVRDALRDHPQSQALRNAAHLLSQR